MHALVHKLKCKIFFCRDKQPDWIQYLDVNVSHTIVVLSLFLSFSLSLSLSLFQDYGYTRINVTPLSLTLQYITIDGSMKDTFTLHKQ